MKKEYVFHGSPVKVEKLIPNQACDIEYKEGCQYAVYATTNKKMAILFSMGCIEEGDDARRVMMPEYGDKMLFKNCHPNYNGKGYLYSVQLLSSATSFLPSAIFRSVPSEPSIAENGQ